MLAVPIDVYEPSKGWTELEVNGVTKDNPKTLGLKDGGVLAFAFSDETDEDPAEFNVEWSSYDEQYGEAESPEEDVEENIEEPMGKRKRDRDDDGASLMTIPKGEKH